MWPFNRRQRQADVGLPPEVHNFYKSEQRDRTNIAWLLGIGTLVATLLLAAVLFFGGRAIYRSVAGNKKANTTATTQEPAPQTPAPPQTTSPAPSPAPSPQPAPSPAPTSIPTPSPTSTAKPTPSSLVNTGPEEDL